VLSLSTLHPNLTELEKRAMRIVRKRLIDIGYI
jgi:hypothetical protein